ncbi:MAG: histidine--tRNA ligase [Leptospiraceae bacterium]|nr:histidine--tRNA ligase [Leptospiraceae bacterium]MDW7975048.1 histidine--tRNA ligase [Leptospiraceae bacterium]
MKKFSSYPGTRDFYPEEMQIRNWFFEKQREVCIQYGYEEYHAPILEFTDLYRSKSSEEIVNEQLYTFFDRGNREVSIRPEMTPTLARMVAEKMQDLILPVRWFSIANFMRYERPGKGRLREFYQLNVDLIGSDTVYADVEILSVAMDILKSYGAKEEDFLIRFSDRNLLNLWLEISDKERLRKIGRLIDKKEKITHEEFHQELQKLCNDKEIQKVYEFLNIKLDLNKISDLNNFSFQNKENLEAIKNILSRMQLLIRYLSEVHDTQNLIFDPSIVRGFDYYTGLIFEIYDTHPENQRAIFGGGRYDQLIGQFAKQSLPAIGFGLGDVTLESFLRNHNLIPHFSHRKGFYFALFDEKLYPEYLKIVQELRSFNIPVELSLQRPKKFGKELEIAEKKKYKYVVIVGEDEIQQKKITIKNLETGKQYQVSPKKEEIEPFL